jgi:hypothetical protein
MLYSLIVFVLTVCGLDGILYSGSQVLIRACSSGDRAKGCGPLGRGFESLQARQVLFKLLNNPNIQ